MLITRPCYNCGDTMVPIAEGYNTVHCPACEVTEDGTAAPKIVKRTDRAPSFHWWKVEGGIEVVDYTDRATILP